MEGGREKDRKERDRGERGEMKESWKRKNIYLLDHSGDVRKSAGIQEFSKLRVLEPVDEEDGEVGRRSCVYKCVCVSAQWFANITNTYPSQFDTYVST